MRWREATGLGVADKSPTDRWPNDLRQRFLAAAEKAIEASPAKDFITVVNFS